MAVNAERVSRRRGLLLSAAAVGTGLLYGFAFPPYGLWLLVLVAYVPCLWALAQVSVKWGGFLGALAAVVGTMTSAPWVVQSSGRFFDFNIVQSVLFFAGVCLWVAVPYALASALIAWLAQRREPPNPWLVALSLTCAEVARTWMYPFPWVYAGHALAPSLWLRQLVEITGVAGLTFLCVLVNASLVRLLWSLRDGVRAVGPLVRAVAPGLIGMGVALLYAVVRLNTMQVVAVGEPLNIVALQVPQGALASPRPSATAYARASVSALEGKPDLVVWPETALEGTPLRFAQALEPLYDALRDRRAHILSGGIRATRPGAHERGIYNTAYLFRERHGVVARYDKQHLIPFGEYLPGWVMSLPLPASWRAHHFGAHNTLRGAADQPLMRVGSHAVGVLICHEVVFRGVAQAHAKAGADLLVNISNDLWAADEATARMTLRMAQLRAVETRLSIIRAAHPGGSALIDPRGEVTHYRGWDEPGATAFDVQPERVKASSFGTATLFESLLVTALSLTCVLVARARRRLN